MRIVSWNVNGLRSVVRRDFESWINSEEFEVVCLQETKVEPDLLTENWFANYRTYINPSEQPGRSGVATLVRKDLTSENACYGMGDVASDPEGRVLTTDVNGIRIVNIYAPHSHRQLTRLEAKVNFLSALDEFVSTERNSNVPLVLVGDFNVAHTELDLANPTANKKNAGFLSEERTWVSRLLSSGFIDSFRQFETGAGHYTWWSMREGVRERNVGWRLDYIFVETSLEKKLKSCCHLTSRTGSDHCPVVAEFKV